MNNLFARQISFLYRSYVSPKAPKRYVEILRTFTLTYNILLSFNFYTNVANVIFYRLPFAFINAPIFAIIALLTFLSRNVWPE